MKILLIGYGKMGKAIEKIAGQRNHSIAGRFDVGDDQPYPSADVAIEFSQPASAPGNLRKCIDAGIPVVCGTTGWLDQKDEILDYCRQKNGGFFYASNFSLGVNIFFRLNEFLAQALKDHPEYNVAIEETHHTGKKDAPSGTAITLAEGILRHSASKHTWVKGESADPASLSIQSFRVDPAPGTHSIAYTSAIDDIEIRHTAHSRDGFARGAVEVAEWMQGKQGIFTMNDFLKF